ncbi:type VI secretion system tip protein VgrG [Halomonas kenyensis]|uniref:Type VI secretion system tip protein VgrG n=2 Tax=Billgrantia kenyensis TaxID=321266 RepID=A0ABS9PM18_9GAMM|nr:type VI secretion system tip protein VgrG [Halomonas kenyensis]
MALVTGLRFSLTLAEVEDLAVIEFTHRERLSAPFELSVRFASRNGSLSARDILDREATLTIWQDDEMLRQVNGIVSEFARGDRGHRHTFYRVEIRPALWRLGLRQNSRIFQEVSPLTVLNTLCDEHGLTDLAFAATREPESREYLTQYREDDLAFVERLAAEEGLFYFHEFFEVGSDEDASAAHRLVFADAPQVLTHLGERTYHGRAGGTPPVRHVRKLQQHARVAPASTTLKDYSFKQPAYDQLHDHAARDLEAHGQRGVVETGYEHYDYPGRYKADASGQAFTRIRLEALRRGANTADAESDLPELAPGTRFTLTDHDLDDLNRDWQVLGVIHHGKQPQALEEDGFVQSGGQNDGQGSDGLQGRAGSEAMTKYHNELVLMPADQAWRPEPNPRPRVDGPQIAFVVGPEGEEIYCDEHGRVKVQFPWDRYAEPNETASAWLRVSQDWAGGGYGSMAIPRIGHEVIVSYLEGDPDQPLITGRIYNTVSTPPYELPAHKTRTVIRTQSHQGEGFNELRLEDEAGQEQIWLHAQKDLELLTHNDRTEEVGNDSHLSVHRNRISEIHADDHLTVRGQRHLKVDGDDHLMVGATRHEKTARAQLVEAGQEIHHQAGSKTVIDAGAEITLKAGGSFLKLDPSGITIVGAQVKINSGGSPGSGSGQGAAAALLPSAATPEASEDVTLKSSGTPLMGGFMAAAMAITATTQGEAESDESEDTTDSGTDDLEEARRQKAARWQCRQGQIAAARTRLDAMPPGGSRDTLAATTERFARNNVAVEHARLAQHVYDPSQPVPVGWEDSSLDAELLEDLGLTPSDLYPEESSFRGGLYFPDPDVFGNAFKSAISFRGTDFTNREDIRNNIAQGLNLPSDYYERAVKIGESLAASGSNIHLTGHSLGGGLVSAASRASGLPATTLNSAGLHPNTVERYGGTLHQPRPENIQAFRVAGEILTLLQERRLSSTLAAAGVGAALGGGTGALAGAAGSTLLATLMPDAVGTPHRLPGRGINPVERHSMVQVIEGLEAQKSMDQVILAEATGHHCT